ncbi:MAG TPA: HEAT repeat domain-containing protein [Gemmatimonadaceae bacterium]|nr:HEAT repeat domain-containing protein [Gemmatimonadaceae bacterium]
MKTWREAVAGAAPSVLLALALVSSEASAQRAARTAATTPDSAAIRRHARKLSDVVDIVRYAAAESLAAAGPPGIARLIAEIADSNPRTFEPAQLALQRLGIEGHPPVRELEPLLRHPNPALRARALRTIELPFDSVPAEAVEVIHRALDDPDQLVREAAVQAMRDDRAAATAALPALLRILGDSSADARRSALRALGTLDSAGAGPVLPALFAALRGDADQYVRGSAAAALGGIGSPAPGTVRALLAALADSSDYVRMSAVEALASADIRSLPATLADSIAVAVDRALDDPEGDVRFAALAAARGIGARTRATLRRAAAGPDTLMALVAIEHLSEQTGADSGVLGVLVGAMGDPRVNVRHAAAEAVAGVGAPARPRLESLASSGGEATRDAATHALHRLDEAARSPAAWRCYELQTPGRPRVRFTSARPNMLFGGDSLRFRIERVGPDTTFFHHGAWRRDPGGDGVRATWSSGFHGFSVRLTFEGDTLRGRTSTFSDVMGAPSSHHDLTLAPVPCPAPDR